MSKRKMFWLGFSLVSAVLVAMFSVTVAVIGIEAAFELLLGMGAILSGGAVLIVGLVLMLESKIKQ